MVVVVGSDRVVLAHQLDSFPGSCISLEWLSGQLTAIPTAGQCHSVALPKDAPARLTCSSVGYEPHIRHFVE